MNKKALHTLEYDKIIEKLAAFAVSPMAKERARELQPATVMSDIALWQQETTEATDMILRKGTPSFGGFREIRPQLKRASMAGVLSISELMEIGEFLYVCRKMKNYGKHENKAEAYERMDEYFELLAPIPSLENEINRCILSETEISDDASAELRNIRKEIKISNEKVRDHLNGVISSSAYRNMLQDFVITIRNDRYCVPVKSEYRNTFPGMIHDQSNTGSTLFMEPLSVIQLNNKIKELQAKEKDEIRKILVELSRLVTENTMVLEANLELLTQMDFIFAKAGLSVSMGGTRPLFNTKGYIHIEKARHPLLDAKAVVPINIYLGKEFTTLLITGPNTGGKTVALKTLGLFTLMGQAGLHIPAFDHSQLAIFDNVFADIGDEQSIEQSLSTFSSHMTNIVKIMDEVTDDSLVLFDELGAGTDPTEGAALALAIIQELKVRKIRTAVTTHYSELKVYALSTKGVENACCEFDVETLRPTYRLLIGIPGKSNAFAISKRLGLQEYIINSAKEFISQDEARFEDVITDLEISKKSVAYEQERAEQYRIEAENLKIEVERQKEKTSEQKEKILQKAREEAKLIYAQAKEEADSIIKEMNRQAKEKGNQQKLLENRSKLKEKLSSVQEDFLKSKKIKPSHKVPENLQTGNRVYVISFDQNGVVLSPPDKNKEVMVQMGSMKAKIPLAELMLDDSAPKENKQKQSAPRAKVSKSQFISAEIDCRGQLVDEALANIDKYIDDAYLSGLKQIVIIHGKGTGALRTAVQSYLKTNSHVKSQRPGVYGEGEAGVTVVELK
ncbi:endonuclease MutS2 [Anaerotignum propionicum]|uniref:Endonuclease MutS2 n=1 Tax=Anaerotignum propionicum DSM 1682 TaxID=991789 RepID=A0A0X8VA51_ANAPI|nr:endonuclease MutS2 [Anaerotignum propionicum]AMJ41836.1 endonuclease MutS2 [Anaerotignum propionicum DSM 1682]SHF04857.1 DNA mismatch repair protein MutS2 [[Clostridium] propionicum DSM 1682] [Anaerotignum propionicum DSM 1682]